MMRIGNPRDWHKVDPFDQLLFEVKRARRIKVAVNSNKPIEIWVMTVEGEYPLLVAAGKGLQEIEVHATDDTLLEIRADDGTAIFMRGHAADQRVTKREMEKYTQLAPQARTATELERVMMMMKHNEKVRQQQHESEMAKRNKEFERLKEQQAVIEPPEPAKQVEQTTTPEKPESEAENAEP